MNDISTEQTNTEFKNDITTSNNVALQFAVIASVFLLIGIMVGAFGYDMLIQSQRDIIEEVIATQIAGQDARIAEEVATTLLNTVQGGQPQPVEPGSGPRREVDRDSDPSVGSPDAPITIIEFSDFRCPYCGRFATTTMEPLLEEYGDYIYFVYRDFPILGAESMSAALASECANEQGAFWSYHDLLFANQQNLNRAAYLDFAEQLNLDINAFSGCIDNETYLEEVQQDASTAQQLGLTGTPAFFINGRYVSGAQPYEVFARIIDEELTAVGIEME